jgi:hypothetical protein
MKFGYFEQQICQIKTVFLPLQMLQILLHSACAEQN